MKKILISDYIEDTGVKFGTSGVRGLVKEMTDECCWLYVSAFMQHLYAAYDFKSGNSVAIAGDLRSSTPRILSIAMEAIRYSGGKPIYCGFIPSPAVMFYGLTNNIPSIMVTGSHIPDDRNGIKFNTAIGEILKKDELNILGQTVAIPDGIFDDQGMIIKPVSMDKPTTKAFDLYVKRYIDFFPEKCLTNKKIGLYAHSSVASVLIKVILEKLGAQVELLGYSEKFLSVDTEAIRAQDVIFAKECCEKYDFDAMVSTDGDGDRPLVSDEYGNWFRGDIIGVLTSYYLKIKTVVTPVNSNSIVEKSNYFDKVVRTRIGSPYVIEGMNTLLEHSDSVAGYEANGGFLLSSAVGYHGRNLNPLPTRDSIIVILSILMLSVEEQCSVSDLLQLLPPRYTASDRLKNFPNQSSQALLASLQSGDIEKDMMKVSQLFPDIGEVVKLDNTDGLRIIFDNEDIIHIRPSGNAPEFRSYTEAGCQERAEFLNRYSMSILETYI